MDSFDIMILKLLQDNCRTSTETIGEQVGLSASACQRRIKKLREVGIIQKEIAILNPQKLAGYTTVIVDVTLEKGGGKTLDTLINLLNQEPQVQQLYYTAGDVDFVVIIVSQSMEDYDRLSRRLFMSNPCIKKFVSKVVIKPYKIGMELPLEKLPIN